MIDVPPKPLSPPKTIIRHSRGVRSIHWSLAACYIPAVLTGFALYWRTLLGWMLPLFGGKYPAIYIHFWTGIGVTLFSLLLFATWRRKAGWTAADTHFVRHVGKYALSSEQEQPPDTGFFNGGQKLYFWSVIASGGIFFVTGLVWAIRDLVPYEVYAVCRTTHRVLGVVMLAGLFVHLYKTTMGEPGTLRSMLRGTVTPQWARLRRPKWFRDL